MSYQGVETSRFGFYDLYKEIILFNNTDVSILGRTEEKIWRMFFHVVMICTRREKKMLLNNSVFREYNQI